MPFKNYRELLDYIFELRRFGDVKLGLERTQFLLDKLGNPEKKMKFVHVGGTAGKGSTAVMISAILKEAGHKTGIYTSPHLQSYTERISINGRQISESDVLKLFNKMEPIIEEARKKDLAPTFAEITTALAFLYFAQNKCGYAVVEVMMGGRLDATNVIVPEVSVITNIVLEHTQYLGNTIEKIATEKAGIIKKGVPAVTTAEDATALKVFRSRCRELGSQFYAMGQDFRLSSVASTVKGSTFSLSAHDFAMNDIFVPLIGFHQITNAALAAMAAHGLGVDNEAIREGLKNVKHPGRMEIVQRHPLVILDCAKDPLAMKMLAKSLKEIFAPKKLILVIGVSGDKKIGKMLEHIAPISDIIIAARHKVQGRAMDPEKIAAEVKRRKVKCLIVEDVAKATKKALEIAGKEGVVCVCGSVFTVGEARDLWFPQKTNFGRELNESGISAGAKNMMPQTIQKWGQFGVKG